MNQKDTPPRYAYSCTLSRKWLKQISLLEIGIHLPWSAARSPLQWLKNCLEQPLLSLNTCKYLLSPSSFSNIPFLQRLDSNRWSRVAWSHKDRKSAKGSPFLRIFKNEDSRYLFSLIKITNVSFLQHRLRQMEPPKEKMYNEELKERKKRGRTNRQERNENSNKPLWWGKPFLFV